MDVILIPGLWLDGSSWEKVVPALEKAGHRTHALTLPGMESKDSDRSEITLQDHVHAAVAAIDSLDPAGGKVVLVGHSAGGAIAHAAVDARPHRVARVVYIGGFPTGDGDSVADGYPATSAEVPLPDWSAFGDDDLADLGDKARAEFRERAIPSPEHVTRDPQQLSEERRYNVPVTVIATEFSSEMLRQWIEQGMAPVREFTRIRDVEHVDLPTGHWPQFTRPEELGQAILAAISAPLVTDLDEQGRPEPPLVAGETASVLGFLDYQRATLAWKSAGLDAAGLQAKVAASSMTLGGILKHLGFVEDWWFSHWLRGWDLQPPWDRVDWDADPDWDWSSAAEDSPEQLFALWQDAVARSRALVAEALPDGGLDGLAQRTWPDGRAPSLRWILLHMIEEYARHNGHADLIRESVDGLAGE
jgi:pimeloyl-ACP methyl ester carboxylesterase